MQSLRKFLQETQKNKKVIWHFNAGSYEHAQAIISIAEELHQPIILGLSEGERTYLDMELVCHSARIMREKGVPLFINADHTHSLEKIQDAVCAGCDEVLFDAGKELLEENIRRTQEVVAWVRAYNQEHGTDVLVEGETGYIGSGSIIHSEMPTDISSLTEPGDAVRFVTETGVDLIAPAVGNIHGIVKEQPRLDIPRIKAIAQSVSVPLVLHGGSGIVSTDISDAILQGITIVHISTELRVAWKRALVQSLQAHGDEIVPYTILRDVVSAIRTTLLQKIKSI